MSERDEHRIRTRKRQGLVWLPSYPGWDQPPGHALGNGRAARADRVGGDVP